MTHEEVVGLLATDPDVIRAKVTLDPGTLNPRAMTKTELALLAEQAVSTAVSTVFQDSHVRRNYLAKEGNLTLVSGTVYYALPTDVVEVLDIVLPEGKPLTKLFYEVEWNRWASDRGLSLTDTSGDAEVFHRATRDANGRFRIRIRPGVSSVDAGTAKVYYVSTIGNSPYRMDALPEETHPMVMDVARRILMGHELRSALASAATIDGTAELVKGAIVRPAHNEEGRAQSDRRNADYTPEF